MSEKEKTKICESLQYVANYIDYMVSFVIMSDDIPFTYEETCSDIDRMIETLSKIKDRAMNEYVTMKHE